MGPEGPDTRGDEHGGHGRAACTGERSEQEDRGRRKRAEGRALRGRRQRGHARPVRAARRARRSRAAPMAADSTTESSASQVGMWIIFMYAAGPRL